MRAICGACLLALVLGPGVRAQSAGPSPHPDHMPPAEAMTRLGLESRAARRYPQPVRVGLLSGRFLLQPDPSQPVLGDVTEVVRRADGTMDVVVRLDGWLGAGWLGLDWVGWRGFGPRLVSVPIDAVGLLGEYIALMDITPENLRALPTFEPTSATGVAPDETIRVGIVKPFH